MNRRHEKITVFHLDPCAQDRQKLRSMQATFEEAFNEFFRESFYFMNEANPDEVPVFTLEFVQSATVGEFAAGLFAGDRSRLSGKAQNCLLFLMEYDLSAHENINTVLVDGLPFARWLDGLFPAVPKIVLTGQDPAQISKPAGFLYLPEETVKERDPDDLKILLLNQLRTLWAPVFWRELYKYGQSNSRTSWHTPGHNHGNAFQRSPYQSEFYRKFGETAFWTDLSVSVAELGDLSEPDQNSPIQRARKRTAELFGAEESFYITNGSSSSNKAMLTTLLNRGDPVLLDRNCHKSVHQAVVLAGALPVYMPPLYNRSLGIWSPIGLDTLERFLRYPYPPGRKPRMLVLTSCSYEGVLYPMRRIAELCEASGILFYADEAWAPYLRFHPFYSRIDRENGTIWRYNACDGGAHFTVHSTHKALAAFSQASMIHVSQRFRELLESGPAQWDWLQRKFSDRGRGSYARFRHDLSETLRYWYSTSPHYPMIATLDLSGIQMGLEGQRLLDERLAWVEEFSRDVNGLTGGAVLGLADIVGDGNPAAYRDYLKDPLKIILGFADEKSGLRFRQALLEANIQWEKAASGCIEFLVTIGTFLDHIKQLKQVIIDNFRLLGRPGAGNGHIRLDGQVCMPPRDAVEADTELVELPESVGRICAQMLVPYPPGIPVFLPGLKISQDMIDMVQEAMRTGGRHDVHGLFSEDGSCRVRVVKGEKAETAADLDDLVNKIDRRET